jgi:hypothetical protein
MEAIAGLAGPVIGGLLGGASGGGSSSATQTASKEPWAPAVPWITSNLQQGQNLQNYYTQNPFNAAQTQAYGNMAQQGQDMRQLIPGLLGQMSGQSFFDRSNPRARPQPFNFTLPSQGMGAPGGGMVGMAGASQGQAMNPVGSMPSPQSYNPAPAPAVAQATPPMDWAKYYGSLGFDSSGGAG